ncbi:hypothetical protein MPH_01253, partial [Macrophomina phaseolina MS6]
EIKHTYICVTLPPSSTRKLVLLRRRPRMSDLEGRQKEEEICHRAQHKMPTNAFRSSKRPETP